MRYKCLRDCTWNGQLWRRGEVYHGGMTPPRHFECLEPALADAPLAAEEPKKEDPKPPKKEDPKKNDGPRSGQ